MYIIYIIYIIYLYVVIDIINILLCMHFKYIFFMITYFSNFTILFSFVQELCTKKKEKEKEKSSKVFKKFSKIFTIIFFLQFLRELLVKTTSLSIKVKTSQKYFSSKILPNLFIFMGMIKIVCFLKCFFLSEKHVVWKN